MNFGKTLAAALALLFNAACGSGDATHASSASPTAQTPGGQPTMGPPPTFGSAAAATRIGNTDEYLGASLTWDLGWETTIVSASGNRIACDPSIAEPIDDLNRPSERPSRPLRPTRGSR